MTEFQLLTSWSGSIVPMLVFLVLSPSKAVLLNVAADHCGVPLWELLGYEDLFAEFVGSSLQPVAGPGLAFVYQDMSIVGFAMSFWVDE
jgi:hypothetical protein